MFLSVRDATSRFAHETGSCARNSLPRGSPRTGSSGKGRVENSSFPCCESQRKVVFSPDRLSAFRNYSIWCEFSAAIEISIVKLKRISENYLLERGTSFLAKQISFRAFNQLPAKKVNSKHERSSVQQGKIVRFETECVWQMDQRISSSKK